MDIVCGLDLLEQTDPKHRTRDDWIPPSFEFYGNAIFINFRHDLEIRSKKIPVESRPESLEDIKDHEYEVPLDTVFSNLREPIEHIPYIDNLPCPCMPSVPCGFNDNLQYIIFASKPASPDAIYLLCRDIGSPIDYVAKYAKKDDSYHVTELYVLHEMAAANLSKINPKDSS